MANRRFIARYAAECDDCGFAFDAGDLVGYDENDNVSHARCLDEAADRESKSRDDDPF